MASSLHVLSRIVFFLIVVLAPAVCGWGLPGDAEEHDSSDSEPAEPAPAR